MSKRKTPDSEPAFWGEHKCDRCANKAYFSVAAQDTAESPQLLCGTHSRLLTRTELPHNPNAAAVAEAQRADLAREADAAAAANVAAGRRGELVVSKLRMLKAPEHRPGFRNVFPNYRHQQRRDGFGCASLSPMSLGPVDHGQPGLPNARSIENYHQFNKCFESELEKPELGLASEIKPVFFEQRERGYRDPVPHRRKYADRNAPVFSIHLLPSGVEKRYTYVQSRYFYCHQYELLAKATADYATLRHMRDVLGYNLQIVGYDAHTVCRPLWDHYIDPERPFGHELVLYTLLTVDDPTEYPWNRYYRENKHLYE